MSKYEEPPLLWMGMKLFSSNSKFDNLQCRSMISGAAQVAGDDVVVVFSHQFYHFFPFWLLYPSGKLFSQNTYGA